MTNKDLRTGVVGELGAKAPCRVATTANITLEGLQTINGVTVVADDRVLVKSQTDLTENGIYIASTGEWQRAVDFDDILDGVPGSLILAVEGAGFQEDGPLVLFVVKLPNGENEINFGTTEILIDFFAFASGSGGGTYLIAGNNLNDVDNAATSRNNLGLEIGIDVQAYNPNLAALSGLTGAVDKLIKFTAPETMELIDISSLETSEATTEIKGVNYIPKPITMANNATDPEHDIDSGAGNFAFDDGSGMATISALTKKLDANWVAGNNQGGLDTGTVANNTWYCRYAIHNPTSGVSDILFTATYGSPTLPSGFTKKTVTGCFMTDGSGNIRTGSYFIVNNGNFIFTYDQPVRDGIFVNDSSTLAPLVVAVPPKKCVAFQSAEVIQDAESSFSSIAIYTYNAESLQLRTGTSDNGSLSNNGSVYIDNEISSVKITRGGSSLRTMTVDTLGFSINLN